jgi:hypothetical protein
LSVIEVPMAVPRPPIAADALCGGPLRQVPHQLPEAPDLADKPLLALLAERHTLHAARHAPLSAAARARHTLRTEQLDDELALRSLFEEADPRRLGAPLAGPQA